MGSQSIGQHHPGTQGNHCQHQGDFRLLHCPEVPVQQEQHADAAVAGALNAQIRHAHGQRLCLLGAQKNTHKLRGQQPDGQGDQGAEYQHQRHSAAGAGADSLPLPRSVILGREDGIGIAELLGGHISQGINFHTGSKGRHDGGAEAVDQSLNHQDAEIHHRLLCPSGRRIGENLPHPAPADSHALPRPGQQRFPQQRIPGDAQPRRRLSDDCGLGGSGHTPMQHRHKDIIQADIQNGTNAQEHQRHHRISRGPEHIGKIVI